MAYSARTSGGAGMRKRASRKSRTEVTRQSRVVLSPITIADAPALFNWINDRELVLFNAPFRPVHEASHSEWLKGLAQRRDLVAFAIRLRRGGSLIGICQLTGINQVSRSADLQIRIGVTGARGKGLGLEAVQLLLSFGFRDLNLHRIALQVFATNTRAIKTYAAAGFRREGVLRDAAFVDGRFVDVCVMARLEGDSAT